MLLGDETDFVVLYVWRQDYKISYFVYRLDNPL